MLPPEVIEEDHRLESAAEQSSVDLWRHRWHWTADPDNAERVSQRVYAAAVHRDQTAIGQSARAYELWRESEESNSSPSTTLSDIRYRASMGENRRLAAETIAKARGVTVTHVRASRKAELDAVTELVASTPIADKERRAEQAMELRLTHERNEAEAQASSPAYAKWVFIAKHFDSARRSLRDVLPLLHELAEDDQALAEVGGFVENAIAQIRKYSDHAEAAITGTLGHDWDAALQKLQAEEETL